MTAAEEQHYVAVGTAASLASGLAPSADGSSFCYTRLDARKRLLGDAGGGFFESLRKVPHLTFVDLSSNSLCTLQGLRVLPRLSTLLARDNRLTVALDFPPPEDCRLRHVDLRDNLITSLAPWTLGNHTTIETLLLDGNQLRSLTGIEGLRELRELRVASNELRDASSMIHLPRLHTLDMQANRLDDLRMLLHWAGSLVALRDLALEGNPFDVEVGEGVFASTVCCWGYDDVETHVHAAYCRTVKDSLPKLATLDGVSTRSDGRACIRACGNLSLCAGESHEG
jgi:Leucine-rich repeat (LRR) protein